MAAPALHRSTPLAVPAVLKSVADAKELSVVGPLTYPGIDRAGDIVRPAGLDFTSHRRSPWVDLEHGREPGVADAPVGWCRKSLSRPGGDYGVFWSTVDVPGHGACRLPFARTYFDPSDRLQSQVFALYERGALTGYSLEFRPVVAKAIGWSALDRRQAMDFQEADVVRYTCCAVPVCPGALVAEDGLVRKSLLGQVPAPLLKILSDNRLGTESLHPVITKAFAPLNSKRAVARVEKAMEEETPATVYDDEAPDVTQPEETDEGASPTAQALYDAAQMLADACETLRSAVETSEHKAGKKKAQGLCDAIDALAAKATGIGDMIHADVSGDDDMDEDDEEPEVEPEETKPDGDDDGVMKAFAAPHRRVYRKAVKRFKVAEILKGAEPTKEDPELARLRRERERLAAKFQKLSARVGG